MARRMPGPGHPANRPRSDPLGSAEWVTTERHDFRPDVRARARAARRPEWSTCGPARLGTLHPDRTDLDVPCTAACELTCLAAGEARPAGHPGSARTAVARAVER